MNQRSQGRKMEQKRVIGLTGGVGSGKSRILELLKQEYGARVIQTDAIAKSLEEPGKAGYAALVEEFGTGILEKDRTLDKQALSRLVFGDPKARDRINSLIHPLVWEWVQGWVQQVGAEILVVESALLPENPGDIFSEIWYVYTLEENRVQRLIESRGYSRQQCRQMMAGQPSEEEYRKAADYLIDNNGPVEEVSRRLRDILKETF